jgi:hypothetical protein
MRESITQESIIPTEIVRKITINDIESPNKIGVILESNITKAIKGVFQIPEVLIE